MDEEDISEEELYPALNGASLPALKALRKRAYKLYNKDSKSLDKVKLLQFITDMEDRIRLEEYTERLINGEE